MCRQTYNEALPELYRENHFHYTTLTNDLDKPGFPNEHVDMLKHIEVDYWFEENLDELPDIFVSDFVDFFAEHSFKLEDLLCEWQTMIRKLWRSSRCRFMKTEGQHEK